MQHTEQYSPLNAPLNSREEAQHLAKQLQAALDALSLALRKETDLMKAGKLRQALEAQVEKMKLTETFLKAGERFRSNIKYYRETMPDVCAQVQKLHERFGEEVARNMTALATAKAVSESLLNEIVDTVEEHKKPSGYTMAGAATGKAPVTPPLRLNRSL